jgi:hypothetical protein
MSTSEDGAGRDLEERLGKISNSWGPTVDKKDPVSRQPTADWVQQKWELPNYRELIPTLRPCRARIVSTAILPKGGFE